MAGSKPSPFWDWKISRKTRKAIANRVGGKPEILVHDTYGTVQVKIAE